MVTTALVGADIDLGQRIVEALDAAGFKVSAAFWLHYQDSDDWKLWIGTDRAGMDLQVAYVDLSNILQKKAISGIELSRIKLVDSNDLTIAALRRAVGASGMNRLHFKNFWLNQVYFDELIVYRTIG